MDAKNIKHFFDELNEKTSGGLLGIKSDGCEEYRAEIALRIFPTVLADFFNKQYPIPEDWRLGLAFEAFDLADAFIEAKDNYEVRKELLVKRNEETIQDHTN